VGHAAGAQAVRLLGAAPNPLSGAAAGGAGGVTRLRFALASPGRASLAVHDASGRLVRRLGDVEYDAGVREVAWDAQDDRGVRVPSGVYFVRLVSGARADHLKVLVSR
jgi:flagellar hook assembly protein FlgD